MKRIFSDQFFSEVTKSISDQTEEVNELESVVLNVSNMEGGCEFSDDTLISVYHKISGLLSGKGNSNVENQVLLNQKKIKLYECDSAASEYLREQAEEIERSEENVKKMCANLPDNGILSDGINAQYLLNCLPEERKKEILNGDFFVSGDGKYIYFRGQLYEVIGGNTEGTQFNVANEWTIDGNKTISKTSFDFWNGVNGVFQSDYFENLDSDAAAEFNSVMFLLSLADGIAASKSELEIYTEFKTNQYGKRVAAIYVSDSRLVDQYQNFDYSKPSSYYSETASYSNYMASLAAKHKYENLTGKEPSENLIIQYDVHLTLNEGHKDEKYNYYVTFDENGDAFLNPVIYSNDYVSVTELKNILGFAVNEKEVFSAPVSDLVKPSKVKDKSLIMETSYEKSSIN